VLVNGCTATVHGRAARPRAAAFSVAVQYDNGRLVDERVSSLMHAGKSTYPAGHVGNSPSAALLAAGNDILGNSPELASGNDPSVAAEAEVTVRPAGYGPPPKKGAGNRIFENRYDAPAVGRAAPSGIGNIGYSKEYGINNRILEDRHAAKPLGGEAEARYGINNRISEDRHAAMPLGGGVEADYGVNNRILDDRYAAKPLGGGVEANYGVNNRILDDRYAAKPLGGGVEARYGINNRVLDDRNAVHDSIANHRVHQPIVVDAHANNDAGRRNSEEESVFTMGNPQAGQNVALHQPSGEDDNSFISILNRNQRAPEVDVAIKAFKKSVEQRFGSLRHAFRSMDLNRHSHLSSSEFSAALKAHGVHLSPEHEEVARLRFDRSRSGKIVYSDFCSVMT